MYAKFSTNIVSREQEVRRNYHFTRLGISKLFYNGNDDRWKKCTVLIPIGTSDYDYVIIVLFQVNYFFHKIMNFKQRNIIITL